MDDADDWDDAIWSTIDALETSHRREKHSEDVRGDAAYLTVPVSWACRSCTLVNGGDRATCQVCATPRGQVYSENAAQLTAAATPRGASFSAVGAFAQPQAAALAMTQTKKTVQATLPFGRTGAAVSATAAPTNHRRIQHTQQPPARSSTALSAAAAGSGGGNAWPARGPATTASRPQGFPPITSHDQNNDNGDDDVIGAAHGAAMAVAARLRHKGEDSAAKTRYIDDAAAAPTRLQRPQIDRDAARSFVYPTNYSVREYQLTIAEKALYHNTLVSLPTGLGKTLIASVVMYNFYRWFPQGQIVFMAPTKPLVAQQIGACHEIMGIPLSDTAELQGSVPPATRKVLWATKRVFFCTPQSMQNDLQRGICRAERLVCLVVDEAHRATGNYAYCNVIHEVEKRTQQFRVLALSATPGSKFDIIQDVIRNLRITHIESRSADDADVKKYTHARQEEVIKCSLSSQISETKALFLQVFQRVTHRLFVGSIIQHKDPERLTRWYVLQMREKFRQSPNYQSNRSAESDLALLVSLLHARDLLTGHGLASFKENIEDFVHEQERTGKTLSWSKRELLQSTEFQALRLSLEHVGGTETANSSSHPKLLKLREVLHEHFDRHAAGQSSTRAIVFTQYRSSVSEIVKLLEPLFPLIKAQQFVGQGASGKSKESKGQTQKEQQEIVRKFRAGHFNVLVATCIAEEGLDIGEVDLIVSFDALTSPVRMIQRMGRTGRKRVGKVVILVTEGDEEKKLARSVASAKTVSRALTTYKSKFVYGKCPRMIPPGISPELAALEMEIPEFHASQVAGKQQSLSRAPSRNDGEASAEKKDAWKLNELERSIVRGKYTPSATWADAPRNEFLPVTVNRPHFLRRRREAEAASFSSTRSLALLTLVRKMNGVHYDDEAIPTRVELASSDQSSAQEVYRHDNVEEELAFSDPDDFGRDDNMHFSPQYSGATWAPEPMTPARPTGMQTPRSVPPDEAKSPGVASSTAAASARVSPLRQATITGKPSPSPSRRSSAGSGRKPRRKTERPRDAIDDSLLERGERLLQRLNAMMVNEATTSSATDASSLEPELPLPADEPEVMEVELQFPRIARRLQFDESHQSVGTPLKQPRSLDSCVPPPPTLSDLFLVDQVKSHGWKSPQAIAVLKQNDERVSPPKAPPATSKLADAIRAEPITFELLAEEKPATPKVERPAGQAKRESLAENGLRAEAPESKPTAAPARGLCSLDTKSSSSLFGGKPKRSLALRDVPIDEDFTDPYETAAPQNVQGMAETSVKPSVRAEPHLLAVPAIHHGVKTPPRARGERRTNDKGSDETPAFRAGGGSAQDFAETQSLTQQSRCKSASTQEDACSICCEHESFGDDPIVFCGGCDTVVHQFCYGIPVLPMDEWFCDACASSNRGGGAMKRKDRRCELCPVRGSSIAMKQTECGRWVHVQCFMWVPELQFRYDDMVLHLGNIDRLDPDRKTLDCSLCHSKRGGGVIQCAHKRCLAAFHVSCASAAAQQNYTLIQLDEDEEKEAETLFVAYCPLHNKSKSIWKPANQAEDSTHSIVASPAAPSGALAKSPRRLAAFSPSALLASQADSAKKQRKQYRRLKRKYDNAMASHAPMERTPPSGRSPWTKRVRRSEQHAKGRHAHAKLAAQLFIEDEVEAPSGSGDDEDDDEMDEEDEAFINDSSQLLYSPSVPTPVRTKKNKRNSLGDMRAIYARSLIESPPTPAFLRRRRGMLPSNGVISACLQELHDERHNTRSQSSVSSQESHASGRGAQPMQEVIEIMDTSQVDELSETETQVLSVDEEEPAQGPCFDLLGMASSVLSTASSVPTAAPCSEPCGVQVAATHSPSTIAHGDVNNGEEEEKRKLREKIEANRLKALRLLEARRQAQRSSVHSVVDSSVNTEPKKPVADRRDAVRDAVVGPRDHPTGAFHAVEVEESLPSFNLLGAMGSSGEPAKHQQRRTAAKVISMVVSPAFRESPILEILESCTSTDSELLRFEDGDSLEVDALLSLRVALVFVDSKRTAILSLQQHPPIELARTMFKSFLLVIRARDAATAQQLSQSPHVQQMRQLPTCRSVIVTSDLAVISKAVLAVVRDESSLGFGCVTGDTPQALAKGVDANFHDRFRFFRATGFLTLGSVLSLTFRFERFTVKQIPVAKFSEMHWRRMLPWVSENTAKQLHGYFLRN